MDRVQNAPELVVAQAQKKNREAGVEKKKVTGWSPHMLEEVAGTQSFENTKEMVQWRSINQEGINHLWRELCEGMKEEVLVKYKIEEAKKGAYKGRGPVSHGSENTVCEQKRRRSSCRKE